jgi:hypothetical protein
MVVETESTKCQSVDVKAHLFEIKTSVDIFKLEMVVRHIFDHNCTEMD